MSGTSADAGQGLAARGLDALGACLAGWPFAASSMAALVTGGAATLAMLAWPAGGGPVAAFAAEFRRWCFGQEAAGLDAGILVLAITSPIVLSAIVLALWAEPLRRALHQAPLRVLALAASTSGAVLMTGLALFATQAVPAGADPSGPLPFPGQDIRTSVPAPDVELVDHLGRRVALGDFRGRIVVVSSIYSRCATACPMILAEARALVESLSPAERDDVVLVMVTLDPSHDTPETLAKLAAGWGGGTSLRLATGEPQRVERALDLLGFERRRDAETGRIDHSGLFVLIDREGRIAWRLTASSSQPHWLAEAVRALVAEPARRPAG